MENDSLNTLPEDASSAASNPVEIGISVHTDSLPTIVKGDTFEFKVNVSWSSPQKESAVLILPKSSANTKGITQIGMREEHSRVLQGDDAVSNSQFIYTLTADDTGSVSIPAMRFEIPTANGPFEFQSESVSFHIDAPSHAAVFAVFGLLAVLIVAIGVFLVFKEKKRSAMRKKATREEDDALKKEFLLLKARVAKADSRVWLLDLEKICKSWAKKRFGEDNLEALSRKGLLKGWDALLEAFAHARYGGGVRDAFENKETWKLAAKLLNIEEDE